MNTDDNQRRSAKRMLRLSDSGIGMAPRVLERVFEPFFTTKPVGKGRGLGLSRVYGLVKQSEGYIDIDSAPGCGTTVTVYLPRTEIDSDPDGVSPAYALPRASQALTVLVVENDAEVLRLAVAPYRKAGLIDKLHALLSVSRSAW